MYDGHSHLAHHSSQSTSHPLPRTWLSPGAGGHSEQPTLLLCIYPLPVSSFAGFAVWSCHFFLIQGTKSENVMEVAGSFHVLMRKTANWPVRPHNLHRSRHWLPWMALSEHSVSAVYPLKQSDFLLTDLDSEITYCKGRRQLIKFVSGLPPGNLFSPGWFLSGPWHVLIGMTLLADAERRQTLAGSLLLKCSAWHFL